MKDESDGHKIEAGFKPFTVKKPKVKEGYGIAVDIGTTTVAVALVELKGQKVVDVTKRINPQKAYGADVVSRIMYVNEHEDHLMQKKICETIESMTRELLEVNEMEEEAIDEMVIQEIRR